MTLQTCNQGNMHLETQASRKAIAYNQSRIAHGRVELEGAMLGALFSTVYNSGGSTPPSSTNY